jgi:hypothetical protein
MKWLLAGMVYVALAAAAFSQAHWVYADLLLWVSLFAVCYAMVLGIVARGERQARAVGFAVGMVSLLIVGNSSGGNGPVARLFYAVTPTQPAMAGPVVLPPGAVVSYRAAPMAAPAISPTTVPALPLPAVTGIPPTAVTGIPAQVVWPRASYVAENEKLVVRLRAANAVSSIAAGLIASLLGALAFRQARRTTDAT